MQGHHHPARGLDVVKGAYGGGGVGVRIHLVGEYSAVGGAAVGMDCALAGTNPDCILIKRRYNFSL